MAEAGSLTINDSDRRSNGLDTAVNGFPSIHVQTTMSNGSLQIPSPRETSPDKLTPQSAGSRPGGVLKSPFAPVLRSMSDELDEHYLSSPQSRHESEGTAATPTGVPEQLGAGKKFVQFTSDTQDAENQEVEKSRTPSVGADKSDEQIRPLTLMARLRALASSQSGHTRSASGSSLRIRTTDDRDAEGSRTPRHERGEQAFSMTLEEENGSDADAEADAEESAGEHVQDRSTARKRKRRARGADEIEQSAVSPPSPNEAMRPGFMSARSLGAGDHFRPFMIQRSATEADMAGGRTALSEDEGRTRTGQESPWRRKHSWRNLSYSGQRRAEASPDDKRPTTLRNFTPINSHGEGSETPRPSRRRMMAERGSTLGAAKWRQLRNGMKLFAQGKKKEKTIDHEKSAELLAELAAGGPAVLMFASMFQRDEHGSRRIPVLLEQIKVNITDSEVDKTKESSSTGERHIIFRIELEYGSGVNRMNWVVRRSLRDFVNLHLKYKFYYGTEKLKGRNTEVKSLPKFPKKAFPWLKSLGLDDEDDDDDEAGHETDGVQGDSDPVTPKAKTRPSLGASWRKSSTQGLQISHSVAAAVAGPGVVASNLQMKRDTFAEKQRKSLEVYLQKMIKFMLFRADSNRLCKFLEVSALGMRLAAEGSYHGKEGFLVIRSAKGLDFRKALTPSNLRNRHTPKWFLVRHSYIVCVDSPEEMHIYDVFLVDSEFSIQSKLLKTPPLRNQKARELAHNAKESAKHPQHHRLKLQNSERKLKLLAKNERQLLQFEESIRKVVDESPWSKPNRFDSFAPVRPNCFAQWLVDGRDYMWVVSRAINQAKDVIYIHDWWLSPEIYMRRPPAISPKWRLDRLLKRKAEQGVKIFVIVYRNIESAVPIDSQYTKFSLLDLHPNIFVQRSPNQFRQNTFFWAHHEKLCIVDHTLAFVGGIDLCFGRWDTPQHSVVDDKPTGFETDDDLPKDADHCQLWPGKDYSNPRVQDFYALNKPYEEMYNREQIARMPWHDISMQVIGQPARDLTRHFVQRWNYILRQRRPTRPTPFLLPPPDFTPADLEALGLDGTCEVQILRSSGPWSLGTPDKTEHSIMNAYVKLIEDSDHFVYIENQFFISSCSTDQTVIENKIGDALVERIIRAHKKDEDWRAIILIPLIPGFQNTVEQEGGTSVRLIMQYQYRSICRGESSIFGRLRAQGIEPSDYIEFYSLRTWGKIGPTKALVTEQLYIHAKCMVVDDRVAIIGSANINERSMLGNRDSECAAVVRDTDMIWSRMNGKPYQVGRFPHSLRMRLMREHLGLDIDKIMEEAQVMEAEHRKNTAAADAPEEFMSPQQSAQMFSSPQSAISHLSNSRGPLNSEQHPPDSREELLARSEDLRSFNHDVDWEQEKNPNLRSNRRRTEDPRVTGNNEHRDDVKGLGFDNMSGLERANLANGRDTEIVKGSKEILLSDLATEGKASKQSPVPHGDLLRLPSYVMKMEAPNPPMPPRPSVERMNTAALGLPMVSQLPALPAADDTDIGGPPLESTESKNSSGLYHPLMNEIKRPLVDRDCMQDPLHDVFAYGTWHEIAENNTKIYRAVFRCMPDNQVRDWKEYNEYVAYEQRFGQMQGNDQTGTNKVPNRPRGASVAKSGPPGAGAKDPAAVLKAKVKLPEEVQEKAGVLSEKVSDFINEKGNEQPRPPERENLQSWAAEQNRAQAERQQLDHRILKKQETFPALFDEKVHLETVPESPKASPMQENGVSQEDDATVTTATERPGSSPSFTLVEKGSVPQFVGYSDALNMNVQPSLSRRRRRTTTRGSRRDFNASDDLPTVEEADELLDMVQGHLVIWPYEWLEKVEAGGNWLFPLDQITPIEIYV